MKLYRVCEYNTEKEVFRGSAQECADFLKVKDAKTFQAFVYQLNEGRATGKKLGYVAYEIPTEKVDWNTLQKDNLNVLQAFYQEYWRSPREDEFIACGGNMDVIRRYKQRYAEYIKEYGYDNPRKWETYEAIDENGEVVYIGTSVDMEEQFGIPSRYMNYYIRNKVEICHEGELIQFRKKPFTGLRGE